VAGKNPEANPRARRARAKAEGTVDVRGTGGGVPQVGGQPPTFSHVLGRVALDEAIIEMILNKSAASTRATHKSQWRWWELFCRVRNISPYRRVTDESFDDEEKLFIDFAFHCCQGNKWAPGTLKNRLSAIRNMHTSAGYGNPLERLQRVYDLLDGYERAYGGKPRRYPVRVEHLLWIRAWLDPKGSHDDAAFWGAISTAFAWLLRASEVVSNDHSLRAAGRGLRGRDVQGIDAEGHKVQWIGNALSVDLLIQGSKTDQQNQGSLKNHFRVGPAAGPAAVSLCPIAALEAYPLHAPERFSGTADHEQLFVWASDRPLCRDDLQAVLRRAALACGDDPGRMAARSLRFGGATALWAAFQDSALVQRWGRWKSDAFHGYLWEGRDTARGVAEKMLTTVVSVL
jgi:hypothetical protein